MASALMLRLACISAGALAGLTGSYAAEATYPSKPIRLVVPYPPGGSADPTGRAIGQWLSERLGTTIVIDGIMYISSANEVYALDAGTGRQMWHYQRPRTKGLIGNAAGGINRGVAVSGERLFLLTDHAHMIAMNRFTGELLWENRIRPSGATGAASASMAVVARAAVSASPARVAASRIRSAFATTLTTRRWFSTRKARRSFAAARVSKVESHCQKVRLPSVTGRSRVWAT